MIQELRRTHCPVCGNSMAVNFFMGGEQPLATLAWPQSVEAAQSLPRHHLDFVQCPSCTHVWNQGFHYDSIPYETNPNRMFNKGGLWSQHLEATSKLILDRAPIEPVVVDIGCGEGHFLRGLAQKSGKGRFLGFDPGSSPENGIGVEFHARLFDPLRDTIDIRPDVIIIRHVLEHLTEVSSFIEQLSWGALQNKKTCLLFAEVPCIDRVLETDRLADFFYEHVAHFTTTSFSHLMGRGGKIHVLDHGYDKEVVFAVVELTPGEKSVEIAKSAAAFSERASINRVEIAKQITDLSRSGNKIAVWGGTGKAAAFLHHYNGTSEKLPLVVDSDRSKVGSYVPGTGQRIEFRDQLKYTPADIIIVPSQWRARDIVCEMKQEGISAKQVLIEHKGRLIDFEHGEHPYNR